MLQCILHELWLFIESLHACQGNSVVELTLLICRVFIMCLFAAYLSAVQIEVLGVHVKLSVVPSLLLLCGIIYVISGSSSTMNLQYILD